jgi:site-specific DNA-methyltransferase (adenine-specific)
MIEPYYQEENITIYNDDCLEVMRWLPSYPHLYYGEIGIALVLTDPPYGKNCDKGTHGFGSAKNRKYEGGWDNLPPTKEVFDEIFRVSRNQIIFGGNYFRLPLSNHWIVWDKKGEIEFKNPFADCELIWTSFTKSITKYVFKQQGYIKDSKDSIYHPTQKPSELIRQLIKDYSKVGDTILDPFLGSGTTCRACKDLGRKCIGIEISKKYCDIAVKRLGQEVLNFAGVNI